MKLEPRKLNIALILIYLACMIFTAFTLIQLQDDMVYSSQALSISEITAARPVLVKLNLVVGFTLLIGLAALVMVYRNRSEDIIYVEKKRVGDKNEDGSSDDGEDEDAKFSTSFLNDILKSEKDEQKLLDKSLASICKKIDAGMGVIYRFKKTKEAQSFELKSSFALSLGESQTIEYELGEGLVGQAGKERNSLIIDDIPEGYIKIVSGLGSASPTHLLIMPVENGKNLYGVIEIASFTTLDKHHEKFVKSCMAKLMEKLNSKESSTKSTSKQKPETEKKEVRKGEKTKSIKRK